MASFGRIERHRIVSRFGRARHVHPVKRLKGSTSPTLRRSALLHFATSHLCESTPSGYRLGIGLLLHSFLTVGCRHLASPLIRSLVSRLRVSPSNRTPYGDCIFGAVKDRPPSFRLTACLHFVLSGFAKVTPTRSAAANSKIGLVGLSGRPTFRFVMIWRPSKAPVDAFSACRRYRLLSGCATLTPPAGEWVGRLVSVPCYSCGIPSQQ